MVQWKNFQYDASTGQPEANLIVDVIREYDNPIVTAEQIANEVTALSSALCGFLWHRGVVVQPTWVKFHLDVSRSISNRCQPLPSPNVRGYFPYSDDDFYSIG